MKYYFLLVLISLVKISSAQEIAIYSKMLDQTIIGIGETSVDLNDDAVIDFKFEIINLGANGLAARVISDNASLFLDNSTFGYPDALTQADPIAGSFNSFQGVLGTFNNAGQFKGVGNRYLGVQVFNGSELLMGWILLNCSVLNDTLRIIESGVLTSAYSYLNAGQQGSVNTSHTQYFNTLDIPAIMVQDRNLIIGGTGMHTETMCNIYSVNGSLIQTGQYTRLVPLNHLETGIYIVELINERFRCSRTVLLNE
jgi:hypothetical protein